MTERNESALQALFQRQSCRKFSAQQVDRSAIEAMIDAGRLAATARNVQPWRFVAVTDPDRIEQIAEMTDHGKFMAHAPLCIAVLCDDTKYYLEDGCAATQNILNAAHALGLGSCWIAGDKKPYAPQIVKFLGGSEAHKLVALIAVGCPAEPTPRANKKSIQDVLYWEKLS